MNRCNILQWDERYPNKEILEEDIKKQELYIGRLCQTDSRGDIVVAYVLNGECDKQYSNAIWEHPEASYWIIHRLCVSPKFQNQKIGNRTMQYIEKQVLENDIESIRIDTFV